MGVLGLRGGLAEEVEEEVGSVLRAMHCETSRRQVSIRAEDLGFGGVFSRALSRFLRESMMEEGAKVPPLVILVVWERRVPREVTEGMMADWKEVVLGRY